MVATAVLGANILDIAFKLLNFWRRISWGVVCADTVIKYDSPTLFPKGRDFAAFGEFMQKPKRYPRIRL
jgi:hypothetical protein